jgi:hypothetical protein
MTASIQLTLGNSSAPNGWGTAPNDALTRVGAGGQDTNFGDVSQNSTGTSDFIQGWLFNAAFPTDFETMQSLSIQLRYGWDAFSNLTTWGALAGRITDSTGTTILAAADSGGAYSIVASNITTTTPTNSSVLSFSFVDTTASKATWENAIVELLIQRTRVKGGTTNSQRVYAASIDGVYNLTAPPETRVIYFT